MKQLVLYGAGKRCRTICQLLKNCELRNIWIVDSNPEKWRLQIENFKVRSPEILFENKNVDICITIADEIAAEKIRQDLYTTYNVEPEHEVKYNLLLLQLLKINKQIEQIFQTTTVSINTRKNVLFDCYNGLGLGGVEAWTMDLCSAMLKKGINNISIISDEGKYTVPEILENHILHAQINHKVRFSIDSILSLVKIILAKLPCDVVTCTTDEVMVAAYLVKKIYPDLVRIIAVIHNSNARVYSDYMDFRECIDLYIGVSVDIKQELIARGINENRVFHMTCPFHCEKILNRTYSLDRSQPIRIGYAGRMDGLEHSQKRMDLMMKLIEELVRREINFIFQFAGDGPAKKVLEDFILINHLESKVKLVGLFNRHKMSEFWKNMDIFVNLADYEGRSISLLEAMANGVVPIVTKTSGVCEEIVNGLNGYYVSLGDYLAIADKINYLYENRELLPLMGKLSHDKVFPESSMDEHVNFWREVLY